VKNRWMSTAATGLILGDARGGQPGDQAGLHDAEAAGDGDGAADEACKTY